MAYPAIVTLSGGKPPSDPEFLLDAATGAVRAFAGWHITPPVDEVMVLSARGGGMKNLQLPTLKINEVSKIMNGDVDVTDYVMSDWAGYIYLKNGFWTSELGAIEITLNHGFELDDVPDVAGIISRLAARALTSTSNIASQRAGSMYVQYGTSGGLPLGTNLLTAERRELLPYVVVIQ